MNIAIVGATGNVGRKTLEVLEKKEIKIDNLYLVASSKSAGIKIKFRGEEYEVVDLEDFDFSKAKIIFFAAGREISEKFNKREMDVLLSSGEQVTSALLSGALTKMDVKAKSWLNWQIPILTEGEHTNSRIVNINVEKINEYLDKDGVAILPGFQGCLLYTSPSPRDGLLSRMPSSA